MKNLTKWMSMLAIAGIFAVTITACSDDDEGDPAPIESNDTDILSFTFDDFGVNADISGTDITASLPLYTDLTELTPTIQVAEGATVSPESGEAQDFSETVEYTVTAEDGSQEVFTVNASALMVNIETLWEKNLNAGNLPSWYTANNDRDIAAFGEYVYVHNNNDRIRVVSASNGEDVEVGELGYLSATQNFGGGNLNLLTSATDSQGRIIGGNLRVGSADGFPWNMYIWDDNEAEQELLFSYAVPEGVQLADNISFRGDARGSATLWAPASGFAAPSDQIYKFNIEGGELSGDPEVITLDRVLGNAPDVVPISNDANTNLIVLGTGIENIAEYDQNGNLVAELPEELKENEELAPLFNFALDAEVFTVGDRSFIAATATEFNDAVNGFVYFIDFTDGLDNVEPKHISRVRLTEESGIDTNFNGTGGVAVQSENGTVTVYGMLTNFGFGAYSISIE